VGGGSYMTSMTSYFPYSTFFNYFGFEGQNTQFILRK